MTKVSYDFFDYFFLLILDVIFWILERRMRLIFFSFLNFLGFKKSYAKFKNIFINGISLKLYLKSLSFLTLTRGKCFKTPIYVFFLDWVQIW